MWSSRATGEENVTCSSAANHLRSVWADGVGGKCDWEKAWLRPQTLVKCMGVTNNHRALINTVFRTLLLLVQPWYFSWGRKGCSLSNSLNQVKRLQVMELLRVKQSHHFGLVLDLRPEASQSRQQAWILGGNYNTRAGKEPWILLDTVWTMALRSDLFRVIRGIKVINHLLTKERKHAGKKRT